MLYCPAMSAFSGPVSCRKPLVCVMSSIQESHNGRFLVHSTGQKNVDAVSEFTGCIPLLLPAMGERMDVHSLVPQIDGLVLTGGRANVEPHHYDGPAFPDDEAIDPCRDGTALTMVRACVAEGIPVFGICRGIQEMNVALGGSLHYRVHLLPGRNDHRMPRREGVTPEEIFKLRHAIKLTPGGLFAELTGQDEVMVNSLHGQGINRLADCLAVEGVTEDGVIEGVRLKNDPGFTVGVQWHAEWRPQEHQLSRALFERFGEAARKRADARNISVMISASVA